MAPPKKGKEIPLKREKDLMHLKSLKSNLKTFTLIVYFLYLVKMFILKFVYVTDLICLICTSTSQYPYFYSWEDTWAPAAK